MAVTRRPPADRPVDRPVETSAGEGRELRGFRPASRRRSRIAAGSALAALAISGNVLLYTSLDDKTEVLQLVDNVRAGERVTGADLRIVEVDLDPTVPVVEASDIGLVADRYARVFLPAGSLIHPDLVQSDALISDGAGVVAVQITPDRLPAGLTTRSQVLVVLVEDAGNSVVTARVVLVGSDAAGDVGSLSVEVDVADAPAVAAADDVRVVLIEPGSDPATEVGATQAGDG